MLPRLPLTITNLNLVYSIKQIERSFLSMSFDEVGQCFLPFGLAFVCNTNNYYYNDTDSNLLDKLTYFPYGIINSIPRLDTFHTV